ncbi:MAG: hypothetical protein JXB49_27525 [Bacteroidales bacterium]|nr:hypothetical protein [Bacteroidales bacterium]
MNIIHIKSTFNYRKIHTIIVSCILFFYAVMFSSCSMCHKMMENSSWQLVYENNNEGEVINGSVADLIEAIKKGKELRVVTYNDEKQTGYATIAENIWIKNGIVYMQNTTQISVQYNGDDLNFQDNAFHWYIIINTNGIRNMSRWYVGEHTPRGNDSDRVAAKWFVK